MWHRINVNVRGVGRGPRVEQATVNEGADTDLAALGPTPVDALLDLAGGVAD